MSTTEKVPEKVPEKDTVEEPVVKEEEEKPLEEQAAEKPPSEEQPVAVTGIQFMEMKEVTNLMLKIKGQEPIGKGNFKTVYKLNDTDTEVVSVEVNEKEDEEGEEMVSVPFKQEEKEGYKNIMDKMYDLDDEHKKYLLLPTKYGYSEDKKTRVQILPYCKQNGKNCNDLWTVLFKKGCSYEKSIMTDCVNILKTIHELHIKKITCMDIKPENTFVNCPSKAFLSLGDTDGFKIKRENDDNDYNCTATPGLYVKIGHFITDYYALLQVFLLVYIFVHKGGDACLTLYNSELLKLHGQMYDFRDINDINEKLAKRETKKILGEDNEEGKMTDQALLDVFKDKKKFKLKLNKHHKMRKERKNYDPQTQSREYKEKSADLRKVVAWLYAAQRASEIDVNLKNQSVHENYKNLIMELLGKKDEILLQKILDALKACIDVETVNNYIEDDFYKEYIEPITKLDIEPITITKKTILGRMKRLGKIFARTRKKGGRKSKKSSRGKKKKTRRRKKKTRRKKKSQGKKKKTRGKKR